LNKGSAFTEQERKFFQGLSWIKSHIQGSRLHYSVNVSNWIMTGSKIVYVVDDDTGVLESTTDLLNTVGFKTKGYKSAASCFCIPSAPVGPN
jgi:hypothetical protein